MINSKPKNTYVQSLGSESVAFPRQLSAVASWNFRNILPSGLPTQKCWVRIGERLKGKGKGILSLSPLPLPLYPAKGTWLSTRATDLLLLISRALLLGIDITLNPPLSKEFQGENR
ncbi:hypothetical protein N0Y54_41680 [Nostoc punctiforme UO1]|uniref:hypothetical protein n=1 Tax=Nostoc punctiforme TaxID=272131 RepID=UPI0030AAFA3B